MSKNINNEIDKLIKEEIEKGEKKEKRSRIFLGLMIILATVLCILAFELILKIGNPNICAVVVSIASVLLVLIQIDEQKNDKTGYYLKNLLIINNCIQLLENKKITDHNKKEIINFIKEVKK